MRKEKLEKIKKPEEVNSNIKNGRKSSKTDKEHHKVEEHNKVIK